MIPVTREPRPGVVFAVKPAIALLVLLPSLRAALALLGFARTRAWVQRVISRREMRAPSAADIAAAEELARLAAALGRRQPIGATCLPQALAVQALLGGRGLGSELKLGVRKSRGRIEAHAWVELAGIALAQAGLDHQPLDLVTRTATRT